MMDARGEYPMDNRYMDMFLNESQEHLQSFNEGLLRLEKNMGEVGAVHDIFRNVHTLKGMSAMMGFSEIAVLTHAMEDVLDLVRRKQRKLNEDTMGTLFQCLDSLEQMLDSIGNGASDDVVDVTDLIAALRAISKGVPAPAAPFPATVVHSAEETAKKEPAGSAAVQAKKQYQSRSVRVDIEKLNALKNLVDELVINNVRLEQIGQAHRMSELMKTLAQMDRVTDDLQNIVMTICMVSVRTVFSRFPRMVREVSKELGKEINLTIEGEGIELDRIVIDGIVDPIMHLLRNAIDHGIESPEKRAAKGKPRVGEIGLIARYEGNHVVLMITDDGAGIDANKIRRKAVETGMIAQEEADRLNDREAVRLIFLPGFSTAEQITDISGRGVGMDIVRSKIEALSGHVDVETHIDEGSVFRIKLPHLCSHSGNACASTGGDVCHSTQIHRQHNQHRADGYPDHPEQGGRRSVR